MGKGDKKTRRGKLFSGTYGKTRPRKAAKRGPVASANPKPEKKDKSFLGKT
jgi:30S ribosomal protein S31